MRSITLCLLVAICISMSFGDFDYTISDTYYGKTGTATYFHKPVRVGCAHAD